LDSAEIDKQNYEREMSAFKKTETFKSSTPKRKKKNQVNNSHVQVSQQSSPLDMNISGANSSFGAHTVVTVGNLPGSSGMSMMNRASHMNHDNTGMEIPIFTEDFLRHSTGWFA